jgi:hypothetical protein
VKPSVGRIVHYHYTESGNPTLKTRPAVMVDVEPFDHFHGIHDGTEENRFDVFLLVYNKTEDERRASVPFSMTGPKDGHWTWPPRV